MPERFELAAARHLRVGTVLFSANEIDDAAYHFGVGGENAIKHALRSCGLEAVWAAQGKSPHETPMRKHFPNLTNLVLSAQNDIALNATGRLAQAVQQEVIGGNFGQRYGGWSIDIRYADDAKTPVSNLDCTKWKSDTEELVASFLV